MRQAGGLTSTSSCFIDCLDFKTRRRRDFSQSSLIRVKPKAHIMLFVTFDSIYTFMCLIILVLEGKALKFPLCVILEFYLQPYCIFIGLFFISKCTCYTTYKCHSFKSRFQGQFHSGLLCI